MNKILDRMGWYDLSHSTKHWIVWFLLVIGVGTVLELIPMKYELRWPHMIALAIIVYFLAKLIVGKPKEKETCDGEEVQEGKSRT